MGDMPKRLGLRRAPPRWVASWRLLEAVPGPIRDAGPDARAKDRRADGDKDLAAGHDDADDAESRPGDHAQGHDAVAAGELRKGHARRPRRR